jgi:hypothetical protein
MGNPGRIFPNANDIFGRQTEHYPWPYHYERGMPWEGIGYDKWLEIDEEQK